MQEYRISRRVDYAYWWDFSAFFARDEGVFPVLSLCEAEFTHRQECYMRHLQAVVVLIVRALALVSASALARDVRFPLKTPAPT